MPRRGELPDVPESFENMRDIAHLDLSDEDFRTVLDTVAYMPDVQPEKLSDLWTGDHVERAKKKLEDIRHGRPKDTYTDELRKSYSAEKKAEDMSARSQRESEMHPLNMEFSKARTIAQQALTRLRDRTKKRGPGGKGGGGVHAADKKQFDDAIDVSMRQYHNTMSTGQAKHLRKMQESDRAAEVARSAQSEIDSKPYIAKVEFDPENPGAFANYNRELATRQREITELRNTVRDGLADAESKRVEADGIAAYLSEAEADMDKLVETKAMLAGVGRNDLPGLKEVRDMAPGKFGRVPLGTDERAARKAEEEARKNAPKGIAGSPLQSTSAPEQAQQAPAPQSQAPRKPVVGDREIRKGVWHVVVSHNGRLGWMPE
jgi:hypothetical protein